MVDERIDIGVYVHDHASHPAKNVEASLEGIGEEAEGADNALSRLTRRLKNIGGSHKRLQSRVEGSTSSIRRMKGAVQDLNSEMDKSERGSNTFTRSLRRMGRGFMGFGRGVGKVITGIGGLMGKMGGSGSGFLTFGGGRGGGFGFFAKTGGMLGGLVLAIGGLLAKVYLLGALVPSLITTVSALGAGLVSLLAPAGLLASNFALLLPAMVGMAGTVGVLTLAFSGLGEAIGAETSEEYNEAIKGMGENTVKFVDTVRDMKKEFGGIKKGIQETFFGGNFTKNFEKFANDWMPMLATEGERWAKSLRGVAGYGMKVFNTPGFRAMMTSMSKSTSGGVGQFGKGFVELLRGFGKIGTAAAPAFEKLGAQFREFITGWADDLDVGEMTGFFDRARESLVGFFGWIKNVGGIIGNVAGAGSGLGNWITESIGEGTSNLLKWTGDSKNQQKMKEWFDGFKPTLTSITGLVGEVFTQVGRLSQSENTPALLDSIKNTLPGIGDALLTMDRELVPGITRIVNSLGDALSAKDMNGNNSMTVQIEKFGDFVDGLAGFIEKAVAVATRLQDAYSGAPAWVQGLGNAATSAPQGLFGENGMIDSFREGYGQAQRTKNAPPVQTAPQLSVPNSPYKGGVAPKTGFEIPVKPNMGQFLAGLPGKIAAISQKLKITPKVDSAQADGKINGLKTKADSIPKEKKINLNAQDTASKKIDGVKSKANTVPKSKNTTLKATDNASGTIDSVKGSVNSIPSKKTIFITAVQNVVKKVQEVVGALSGNGRWAGGPVDAGKQYTVNELGSEGFISKSGKFSMINGGMQQKTFAESGTVIPAHIMENPAVRDALTARGRTNGPQGRPGGREGGSDAQIALPPVQVTIQGDVNRGVQIEQAVRAGIKAAMREQKERS